MVGIPHAKWGERPLLVVVPQPQYAPGGRASLIGQLGMHA